MSTERAKLSVINPSEGGYDVYGTYPLVGDQCASGTSIWAHVTDEYAAIAERGDNNPGPGDITELYRGYIPPAGNWVELSPDAHSGYGDDAAKIEIVADPVAKVKSAYDELYAQIALARSHMAKLQAALDDMPESVKDDEWWSNLYDATLAIEEFTGVDLDALIEAANEEAE